MSVTINDDGGLVLRINEGAVSTVTLAGEQTLTNKTISGGILTGITQLNGATQENITETVDFDVDCGDGNYFTATVAGDETFTFSNAPADCFYIFVLEVTHTSGSITWPASVEWPTGSAPVLNTGKTHLFVFSTDDGGTTWRGGALVDYDA